MQTHGAPTLSQTPLVLVLLQLGTTPLMAAAMMGHYRIVKLLILRGAFIDMARHVRELPFRVWHQTTTTHALVIACTTHHTPHTERSHCAAPSCTVGVMEGCCHAAATRCKSSFACCKLAGCHVVCARFSNWPARDRGGKRVHRMATTHR